MQSWSRSAVMFVGGVLAVSACSHPADTPPAPPAPPVAAPLAPTTPHDPAASTMEIHARPNKPTAPVTLTLSAAAAPSRHPGTDAYAITLTATPTAPLDSLSLRIASGEAVQVVSGGGAITEIVDVPAGSGRDIVGGAAVLVAGRRMTTTNVVHVGAAAARPAAPGRDLTLPDGTVVREVQQ